MSETVRSAARVLDLLEYLAGRHKPATLAEVSAAFGMPKSSTLGLLRTLHLHGYVDRDALGAYLLNDAFRKHGFGWGGNQLMRLMALAQPVMDELAEAVGETTSLLAMNGDGHMRLLMQALTSEAVRYEAEVGQLFPAYCTASGRIMLASMPAAERDDVLGKLPIRAYTPATVTDLLTLRKLIDAAREDGHGFAADEYHQGGTGVAVAILRADGTPLAALNVGSVSSRYQTKSATILAHLKEAAAELQRRLFVPS